MHLISRRLLHLFSLLLLPAFTYAQVEEQEEESTATFQQMIQEFAFAQTVYLQEKREVQQTINGVHAADNEQVEKHWFWSYEAEYGLTDWMQFSAAYAQHHLGHEAHYYRSSELEIGSLLSLFTTAKHAATLSLEAELPLKRTALQLEEADSELSFTPALFYGRQFGKAQLHLNAGAELQAREQNLFYSAALIYGLGRWHPILEINSEAEEERTTYLAPGLVLNGLKGWEIVAGARHSLRSSEWGLSLKVLYEFTIGEQ